MTKARLAVAVDQAPRLAFIKQAWRSRALAAIGGANALILVLGLASAIVAARALGPTARGEFVATYTLATTAALFLTFGMSQAVVTYPHPEANLRGPLILQATFALGAGAVLCTFLAVSGLEPWLDVRGVVGGATVTAAGVTSSLAAGWAQRRGEMVKDFQYARLIPQATVLAGMAVLAVTGNRDTNTWLLGAGLAYFLPALVIFWRTNADGHLFPRIRNILPDTLLLRDALGAFALVIGSQVVYRLDSSVVALWLPPEKVALYAVAVAAATACAAIGQTVGMLAFSELRTLQDPVERVRRVRRDVLRAFVITGGVGAVAMAFTPELIHVAYGQAFMGATEATRVSIAVSVPLALDYLLIHALLMMRIRRRAVAIQALTVLITCALLALTVPTENLALIAGVSLVAHSVSVVLLLRAVNRSAGRPVAAS